MPENHVNSTAGDVISDEDPHWGKEWESVLHPTVHVGEGWKHILNRSRSTDCSATVRTPSVLVASNDESIITGDLNLAWRYRVYALAEKLEQSEEQLAAGSSESDCLRREIQSQILQLGESQDKLDRSYEVASALARDLEETKLRNASSIATLEWELSRLALGCTMDARATAEQVEKENQEEASRLEMKSDALLTQLSSRKDLAGIRERTAFFEERCEALREANRRLASEVAAAELQQDGFDR
eukprot:gnl/MRDRNA2_/MRDRNA2_67643_c0_seq1.p1 gnl/MRDRNA2_/MRDRNA2_67643_c0~~gnl/MRDRNA2_/MRDRNA2_67643_c0_seq1.p1  ORF type:complete len:243 (-),score=51.44 gnl/MRDRNA2_/MRDRNA2_67643_c0_seq1:78-806(-)